jgi:hypothetical protein
VFLCHLKSALIKQAVNLITEVCVPLATNWGTVKMEQKMKKVHSTESLTEKLDYHDLTFVRRVQKEIRLPVYDLFIDYNEMVTQVLFCIA